MAVFVVTNQTELTAAIAAVTGGDTIRLAAGDYAEIRFKNRSYAQSVTIESVNPADPARVATVTVLNSDNLTFRNLDVGKTLAPGEPLFANMAAVTDSSKITFDSIHFHGSLDDNSGNDGRGLSVLDSDYVVVVRSEFEQLGRGAMFGGSKHVKVLDSVFHDIRSDGIDFAQVENVEVRNNRLFDFSPAVGDHADAIQVFTTGTSASSKNLVFADNVIMQGRGGGMQGIFLRNADGLFPFENVVIHNNLVYVNDSFNGIMVQNGRGVVVQNNTVLSSQTDRVTHYIRMEHVNGLVLKDNVSDTFVDVGNSNSYLLGNLRLDQTPGRARELRDLEAGASATAEGLTLPGIGYQPEGAPPPVKVPRIGTDTTQAVVVGATFTPDDIIDLKGGADAVGLQGNYPALTLGRYNLVNVETLAILSGTDTRFGESGANLYSYNVTTIDANVNAGATLTVNASSLRAGENVIFNGAAETDGKFLIYGGLGIDELTGGANTDIFYFGQGAFGADDRVDGGGGADALGLRGNYSGDDAVVLTAASLVRVETVALISAADVRHLSGGTMFSYGLTTHDANVAAGLVLTVNGSSLMVGETLTFDGRAETDGAFRLFGGSSDDRLTGGAGNDWFNGGRGGDRIEGGAGSDVFQYRQAADSTGLGCDQLVGFDCRTDRIDAPGDLAGFSDVIGSGLLSAGSFDADLGVALANLLGPGEAALFTPDAGDLAGRVFVVIDANGQAGYQAGADLVIELVNPLVPINPVIDIFA